MVFLPQENSYIAELQEIKGYKITTEEKRLQL